MTKSARTRRTPKPATQLVRYHGPCSRLVVPSSDGDTVLQRGGDPAHLPADVVKRLKADPSVTITIDPQGE